MDGVVVRVLVAAAAEAEAAAAGRRSSYASLASSRPPTQILANDFVVVTIVPFSFSFSSSFFCCRRRRPSSFVCLTLHVQGRGLLVAVRRRRWRRHGRHRGNRLEETRHSAEHPGVHVVHVIVDPAAITRANPVVVFVASQYPPVLAALVSRGGGRGGQDGGRG